MRFALALGHQSGGDRLVAYSIAVTARHCPRGGGQAGGVRRTSWRLYSTINEPSGNTIGRASVSMK